MPHWQGRVDSIVPPDTGHPQYGADCTPDSYGIQYEFVIDGQRTPTSPVTTTIEAFASLCHSLGLLGQTSHALGIDGRGYESNDSFVICANFEKVLGSAYSGKSLRGGSQLLLNLKNLQPAGIPTNGKLTKCFLAVQYDVILELSGTQGVTVME